MKDIAHGILQVAGLKTRDKRRTIMLRVCSALELKVILLHLQEVVWIVLNNDHVYFEMMSRDTFQQKQKGAIPYSTQTS